MKLSHLALAATALLVTAGAADATTVVYQSGTVSLTDIPSSDTLGLKQFDSSLGTLTGITVTLYGTLDGAVTITNKKAVAADGSVAMSGTLTLTRPDNSTIVITNPLLNESVSLDPNQVLTLTPSASSNTAVDLDASDFALFTGTGYLNAGLLADGLASWTGNPNIIFDPSLSASGYATVTYTYDEATPTGAVPEPATWAMMVAGIGLVGASLRRRRSFVAA